MGRWIAKAAVVCVALFIAVVSVARAQQVWVVGPPGPGVFSQNLQPAINAAANGDIILVKQDGGGGEAWSITGKSLSVIAERGLTSNGTVGTIAPGNISGLQAWQRVLLRGLPIKGRLTVTNNAGPVWMEGCGVFTTFFTSQGDQPVMSVSNCASVTMQSCWVSGYQVDPPSPPAFRSTNSNLTLYDCTFRGATGPNFSTNGPGFHGGNGAEVTGQFTFASGTQFLGGPGGMYACCNDNAIGQAGGAGLVLTGPGYFLNCPMVGGTGSSGPAGSGPDGAPFVGNPTLLTGFGHKFSITSPVREQNTATLTCIGPPGELAAVYISTDQMIGQLNLAFDGVLVAGLSNATSLLLGHIGPAGDLTIGMTAPNLPPSLQGASLYAQSYFFDPQLSYLEIGPASAVVVLDSSL